MIQSFVCPVCTCPLEQNDQKDHLSCPQCAETFTISAGVPNLIPNVAFQRFPLRNIQTIYNRVYSNPGIMGTQLDPEYSRFTKTTLLGFCKGAPNARLLDIGTGDGDLWEFAPKDTVWHGIDLSETGVRRSMQRFPDLRGATAISEWLPYPDAYFGAVIAADTIEHAFDIEQSLKTIRRVLADGGIFAFSVPTPNSLRKWGYNRLVRGGAGSFVLAFRLAWVLLRRTLLFGQPIFQPIDRDLSIEEWRSRVEQTGFRIINVQEWPLAPFKPIVYLLSAKKL